MGVHFTPSADQFPKINIGPTATLALGKKIIFSKNLEPISSARNLLTLANQYLNDKDGFRKYVHEQSLLFIKPLMIKSAKKLIPSIKSII